MYQGDIKPGTSPAWATPTWESLNPIESTNSQLVPGEQVKKGIWPYFDAYSGISGIRACPHGIDNGHRSARVIKHGTNIILLSRTYHSVRCRNDAMELGVG